MFDGTADSLIEGAADLLIQREHRLAACLQTYEAQAENTDSSPHPGLLHEAQIILSQRLREVKPPQRELVHLAVAVGYYANTWETLLKVLVEYHQLPLNRYELAWAWWHQIDCLALLNCNARVVTEQQAFLAWAKQQLPPDHWLFVWGDSTQARCWLAEGCEERWLAQCFHLLEQVEPTAGNRYDRFLLLRSAFTLSLRLTHFREADEILQRIQQLEKEDHAWGRKDELHLQIVALQIQRSAQNTVHSGAALCSLASHAKEQLAHWLARSSTFSLQERRTIRRLAHNIGAELFFAHLYDLALFFFEQAARYGSMSPHTHLWLAASLWMVSKNEQRVLLVLQRAIARLDNLERVRQLLQQLPELEEIWLRLDKEFVFAQQE